MAAKSGMFRILVWIAQNLALAAAIFVTGQIALLAAVSPGLATPIFPPAGIGLAALLLLGYRTAPGVFLGSLLINVTVLAKIYSLESAVPFGLAAAIALGATLQAMLAAWMIRRFVGFPTPLVVGPRVMLFLILGGPVCCLVAASVSSAVLAAAGTVAPCDRGFNWLNSYVGDSIGVLLFTPLLLTWFAEPREIWRQRRWSVGIPTALTLTAAVAIFLYARGRGRENVQMDLENRADQLTQSVHESLAGSVELLESICSLYDSSDAVTRSEFRTFVRRSLSSHPEIQALEWAPRVTEDGGEMLRNDALADAQQPEHAAIRSDLERFAIREAADDGSDLVPARPRKEYFPVYYVEPFEGNEAVLGYDLASEKARYQALREAIKLRQPVASQPIRLIRAADFEAGLLVFLPVFAKHGSANSGGGDREAEISGLALGEIRIDDALRSALSGGRTENIDLQIVDETVPDQPIVVYRSQPDKEESMSSGLTAGRVLDFAHRNWALRFAADPQFVADRRGWHAWALPICNLLFIGLAMTFLLVVTGRAVEVERRVNEKTRALREANAELARSNKDLQDFAYVASHDLQEPLRAVTGFCQLLEEKYGERLDDEGRDYLEFVVDGARRMQALLTGLLQFSRVRTRGQPFEPVDCNEVFDDAVANMASMIGSANAAVKRGNLPIFPADGGQLTQLMQNLIGNSIKYRNAAPPEIRMDVELYDGDWLFCLSDNGIGIAPEHRERVFVIFQRLHTRQEFEGTGIGLAVCKRIVERHHGRIWVESEPGKGSKFFFTIPAKNSQDE